MQRGCTQCGECLNVCPVFREYLREEYSPKGKRILMEPVAAGEGDFTWEFVFKYARLCAGCGRCKKACARKLSTADLLADIRAARPRMTQQLWELWIRHLGPLWPTVGFLASLAPKGLTPRIFQSSLETAKALLGAKNIRPWAKIKPGSHTEAAAGPVTLFSGCAAKNVRSGWADKAARLLRLWGYPLLDGAGFTCCGGTMRHAGQYKAMREMREQNIRNWEQLGKPRVAVFCASCCHSLAEYPEEFKNSLRPLSSLLTGAIATPGADKPATYGYHQPCHWDNDQDLPFLSGLLPGLQKGAGLCCGMGGILKLTDPDLSNNMAKSCLKGFAKNLSAILTGCSGCALQLSAVAPDGLAVYHWLDIVGLDIVGLDVVEVEKCEVLSL
jgi:glycolate oxidase iron-sulfur subunit